MIDTTKNVMLWLMAGALIILAGAFGIEVYRARLAVVGQQVAEARIDGLTEDIKRQKAQATVVLRTANANVLALQKSLETSRVQQEKQDAANSSTVVERRSALVRYRTDTRLLAAAQTTADRRGASGAARPGETAASADSGAGNGASGTGVFSRAATRASAVDEGDADALLADRINVAYASCRADAFAIRQVAGAVTLIDGELFAAVSLASVEP